MQIVMILQMQAGPADVSGSACNHSSAGGAQAHLHAYARQHQSEVRNPVHDLTCIAFYYVLVSFAISRSRHDANTSNTV